MSRSWRGAVASRGSARVPRLRRSAIAVTLLAAAVSGCGDGSPATSTLLWNDFYPGPPPAASDASAGDVAACEGTYFAIGETHLHFLIRAYDAEDGTLRWHHDQPFEDSGVAGVVAC